MTTNKMTYSELIEKGTGEDWEEYKRQADPENHIRYGQHWEPAPNRIMHIKHTGRRVEVTQDRRSLGHKAQVKIIYSDGSTGWECVENLES